jgi:hypothetical protein
MNVGDVARKVVVAANGAPSIVVATKRVRHAITPRAAGRRNHVIAEERFDNTPSAGIIGVLRRQRPNGMQMVWQHDDRLDPEWTLPPGSTKCRAQRSDFIDERG